MPLSTELTMDRDLGVPLDQVVVELAGVAAPQRLSRHTVRAALEGRSTSSCIGDAELVVAELVSNAERHTPFGPTELLVEVYPKACLIRVCDQGPDLEAVPSFPLKPGDYLSPCGRGLLLVAELATWWQAEPAARGKALTAVISLEATAA
jgi:anti-sigma regulatory factor (Ser/Thr protein kinase)